MQGVGFWATRSRGPKARVYSWSVGSSRTSRGTSGNLARNSSTDMGARAERARSSRSDDRRIRIALPSWPIIAPHRTRGWPGSPCGHTEHEEAGTEGVATPGQDHGFTGLVSSQPPLSGEGLRAGGLGGWSMERNRLIAAVSTYQRPSAKWVRRRPGSRGETMESGAILVVQRSPPAVQPRRAAALPRGRGVPLPTRSGRRGGVLRVPPARGAARDAREAVHAPSPSCSARGISALAAFPWDKNGNLSGRGPPSP